MKERGQGKKEEKGKRSEVIYKAIAIQVKT